MKDPKATDIVIPFSEEAISRLAGNSDQAKYIYRYLKHCGAKTCIVERQYIDKDYLIDYQKFYSRSFKRTRRFTRRIHFFSLELTLDQFKECIIKKEFEELKEKYMGFTIVKPIKDDKDNWLIGRTLLKPYCTDDGGLKRRFIHSKHPVSMFGIELEIDSLSFQAQDKGVSACATIALWIAFNALYHLFGLPQRAPAEITEASTKLPSEARIFPQAGLSLQQMITCIRSTELDVEIITQVDEEVVSTAVKAYVGAGIPLIAALELTIDPEQRQKNEPEQEYHAAVIVGYKLNKTGKMVALYVHDDQIGPYSKAEPIGDLTLWKNEWTVAGSKFVQVKLEKLLVPVYHKIRLPWLEIYDIHKEYEKDAKNMKGEFDLYLTTIQKYKAQLLDHDNNRIKGKYEHLLEFLPRFIWVERFHQTGNEEKPVFDHVIDGTAIHPKIITVVDYV